MNSRRKQPGCDWDGRTTLHTQPEFAWADLASDGSLWGPVATLVAIPDQSTREAEKEEKGFLVNEIFIPFLYSNE